VSQQYHWYQQQTFTPPCLFPRHNTRLNKLCLCGGSGIKKPDTWLGFVGGSSGYCLSLRRPKNPSRPPSVSKPNRGSAGTGVAGATGVTLLLAEEAALVPTAFVAVTVKV